MPQSSATHGAKSKAIREIEDRKAGEHQIQNLLRDDKVAADAVKKARLEWETTPPVPERGSEPCQHEEIIRVCRACGEQL